MPGPSDWMILENAYANFVAQEARDNAARRARLAERGEVLIELVAEEEDKQSDDGGYRTDLSQVASTLRAENVPFSQTFMALDSAEGLGHALPEYVMAMKYLAPHAMTAAVAAFAAWVHAKEGRKVRLKTGDFDGEAHSVAEIKELIEASLEYHVTLREVAKGSTINDAGSSPTQAQAAGDK